LQVQLINITGAKNKAFFGGLGGVGVFYNLSQVFFAIRMGRLVSIDDIESGV
jgi:hypothetical protein